MSFVLDASLTLAWALPDEHDTHANRVLGRLTTDTAFVPVIWPFEVGNTLLVGRRRGRFSAAESQHVAQLLASLPIVVVDLPIEDSLGAVVELGFQHRLSTYDASYLALAIRRDLPLATIDGRLRAAAAAAGVALV